MYDGTLAGHWQAIVTMQQMIVLANEDGVVDMTPDAISRRTTIPLEIIRAGIEHLEKPDPLSRTPGDEGKRIELLDGHRPWGWRLVNFAKYRGLRNMEQKKEADRQRIAEKRKKISDVAIPSQVVANVAHTEAEAEAIKEAVLPADAGPVWTECLAVLRDQKVSEKSARSFLGLLCREYDEKEIVDAVKASIGKADAVAYIRGVLKTRPKKGKKAEKRVAI